mmetsp:Transcript_111360/g.193249  ORF Transcript_111360/g.193249 Transcript_111360/m.193249 type:complete len:80 (+) Transcript_111360:262-501(+)
MDCTIPIPLKRSSTLLPRAANPQQCSIIFHGYHIEPPSPPQKSFLNFQVAEQRTMNQKKSRAACCQTRPSNLFALSCST